MPVFGELGREFEEVVFFHDAPSELRAYWVPGRSQAAPRAVF